MPVSYISGQLPNPRRHPTCWASSQWSRAVLSAPCHGAWTSASLRSHPSSECRCMAPQIETLICTRRRRRATHHFIWQQQCMGGAVDGSPMECGVGGQYHTPSHFYPQHRHRITLSRRACTQLNRLRTGVGRFRSWLYKRGMATSAVCERGAEEQIVSHDVRPPISNPSASQWTAWSDGSGR